MTVRILALTALLLASACSRQAPVENTTANQPAPAAAPAPKPANAAAQAAEAKPQQQAEADAGKDNQAGTDAADDPDGDGDDDADATPAPRQARGCAAETSPAAARAMVRLCRDVSPATHPPCNAENACGLIISEIKRGCAMLTGGDRPGFCKAY